MARNSFNAELGNVLDYLADVCAHYEKSAPTVEAYCDDLFRRINSSPDSVRLAEITQVLNLLEDGTWEQPNYAANRIYKLQSRLGMDTTGQAGF